MSVQKRGDDAADHAPQPKASEQGEKPKTPDKQDAKNYEERTDEGQALERENVSSANDE